MHGSGCVLLVLVACILPSTRSHISWTFPQARYPPLDFLDTARTPLPCGVPKTSPAYFTKLIAGDAYNMSWRIAFPHQGGYSIALIDHYGRLKEDVTNGFIGEEDQTRTWHQVTLRTECEHCTLQLRRQAIEWGKSYIFHSCADVSVENRDQILETKLPLIQCTSHGTYTGGSCQCDSSRPYAGDRCQFEVECKTDAECNGGSCVSTADNLPAKICYCPWSKFGANCGKTFVRSSLDSSEKCFNFDYSKNSVPDSTYSKYNLFNPSCYETNGGLMGTDSIYWRQIGDEVEIILDYRTASWLAVGWKPLGLTTDCQSFPLNLPDPYASAEPEPESGHSEPEPEPTGESEPESSAEPKPDSETSVPEGEPEPTPESEGKPSSEPEPENKESSLHTMDCLDVVVGYVKDGMSRVRDHYTRDRSTPLLDRFYQGEDSLSAGFGIENGDRTIVMFRKPLYVPANDKSDHSLGPGKKLVAFAKGQLQGSYSHQFKSGLDIGTASRKTDFYGPDEIKYHGDQHRTMRSFEFTKKGAAAVVSTCVISVLFSFALILVNFSSIF